MLFTLPHRKSVKKLIIGTIQTRNIKHFEEQFLEQLVSIVIPGSWFLWFKNSF